MEKILITVFQVVCLALVMAGQALADSVIFTGSTTLQAGNSPPMVVTTSNNVSMLYNGNTNGQTYGAATKNKLGNRYYATGGGQTVSTDIYYLQSDAFVGSTNFTGDGAAPDNMFTEASGWTSHGSISK